MEPLEHDDAFNRAMKSLALEYKKRSLENKSLQLEGRIEALEQKKKLLEFRAVLLTEKRDKLQELVRLLAEGGELDTKDEPVLEVTLLDITEGIRILDRVIYASEL